MDFLQAKVSIFFIIAITIAINIIIIKIAIIIITITITLRLAAVGSQVLMTGNTLLGDQAIR